MPLTQPITPEDHTLGPDDAPVTLVQYGDYQCPSCLVAARVVDKLLRESKGKLRFAFRHYPFEPRHPLAELTAEAAEFAATHDKFWPMHHALFAHQDTLSREKVLELAPQLGLDPAELQQALDDHRFLPRIHRDGASAKASGVDTTPTFFINGELYTGPRDYASLFAAIQTAAPA